MLKPRTPIAQANYYLPKPIPSGGFRFGLPIVQPMPGRAPVRFGIPIQPSARFGLMRK